MMLHADRERAKVFIERLQAGEKNPWLVYGLCKLYGTKLAPLTSAERFAYLRRMLPWTDPEVIREGLEEYEHSDWVRVHREERELAERLAELERVEAAGDR